MRVQGWDVWGLGLRCLGLLDFRGTVSLRVYLTIMAGAFLFGTFGLTYVCTLNHKPSTVNWYYIQHPLKQIEYGVNGDLTKMCPKPCSIYLRGTIGTWSLQVRLTADRTTERAP